MQTQVYVAGSGRAIVRVHEDRGDGCEIMAGEGVRAWQLQQPLQRLNVGVTGLTTEGGEVVERIGDDGPIKNAVAGRELTEVPCEDRRRSEVLSIVDGQEPNVQDLVSGHGRHAKPEAQGPPVAGSCFDVVN